MEESFFQLDEPSIVGMGSPACIDGTLDSDTPFVAFFGRFEILVSF